MKNQKGQASLESIVAAMGLALFFAFILVLIYAATVYTQLRYTSHEYLLCPEYQQKNICIHDFQKSLKAYLRFGKVQNIQFQEHSSQRKISFRYSLKILNIQNFQASYEDQIRLPVTVN